MIKKLKRKIVIINVVLVGVVLLCVFAALCVNSYQSSKSNLEQQLRQILESNDEDDESKPNIGGHSGDGEHKGLAATVTITVNDSGEIIKTEENRASIADGILDDAVSGALDSNQKSGVLPSLQLIFQKQKVPEGTKIVFADMTDINSALQKNVLVCSVLFLLSIGVLILISLWLSDFAVKPIEKAWIRQKQFVADASHELKTPLTVVLANNNILMSHKNESVGSQQQWLESTDEEAKHMKKLIDQMLMLAKSDMEQVEAVMGDVQLSQMTEEMMLYFEPVAYENGVTVHGEIEPDVTVVSDAVMLKQLVQILLDNAIKYSHKGTEIALSIKQHGSGAELSINNHGDVISPEDMPHIFDRFYRADKARSEGGYGLGLAIAKNISVSLGVTITATSTEESGTTFRVSFSK